MRAPAIGNRREIDPEADDTVPPESWIGGPAEVRTANHQRGADQERERQRDLNHDQARAKPEAETAHAHRAKRVLQLRVHVRPRRLERRREAEERDGDDRDRDRKEQDAIVDRQVEGRQFVGPEAEEQHRRRLREHQPQRAARDRQERALRQQLSDDAPA
jgi:hypothetical protein